MNHGHYRRYRNNRRHGFGMNLYRNTKAKKLGGVCAGIADHFEIDHIVMRIIFVAAVIFTSSLAIWGYLIAWVVLCPKPKTESEWNDEADDVSWEYDERVRRRRQKNMFRYKESPSERIRRAKRRMESVVERVDAMEQHVTSKRFNLNRQFADLEK